MEVVIEPDYDRVAEEACRIVREELARKPALVLGLAAGRTPLGLYDRLSRFPEAFAQVKFFNLDEIYGRAPSDPESFHNFLQTHLIRKVRHDPKNVYLLRGDVADLEAEAEAYEEAIRSAGGIDLQILGVGRNGHVGFNEPGSSLGSRTRPKTLEPETLAQYVKTLDSEAPISSFAITMGVGTIMEARRLLLLATGGERASIIQKMVEGPVTAEVPASVLQLHPRAMVILDEAAAARLKRREQYKWIYENKWRVGPRK